MAHFPPVRAPRRSTRMVALLALTIPMALAACSSDSGSSDGSGTPGSSAAATAGTDAEIDTATWALQSPPASMDIVKAADVPSRRAIGAAFECVLTMDNNGSIQPWLAESWTSPDPLTFVFSIRSGVTFWDGSPLTAQDVAASLQRIIDPEESPILSGNFSTVESVEATDDATVTVKLSSPDANFLYRAAQDWYVQSQAYVEAAGADLGSPSQPGMGTGAYSITTFSATGGATMERNDGYWGAAPKVQTLEFTVIGDPETARLAMLSGEIDGYFDVPLLATRQFDALDNASMTYVTGGYNDMLSMRVTTAPFDDVNVRKAIAHLVDREGLVTPLFNGHATVARTVVPAIQLESALGADAAATYYEQLPAVPEFDIEAAKAALAESSSPDGFTVDLPVDSSQPWMSPLAQNLAENAKQVGITIYVVTVSGAEWVAALTDPEASPLQLVALGAGTPNPGELPLVIFGDGTFPVAGYGDPQLQEQLDALVAAPTTDEVLPLLTPVLTSAGEDLPYLPLYDEQTAIALADTLVWQGGYSYWAIGQAWPLKLRAAT